MMRTSKGVERVAPMGRTSRVSITRSSFTCSVSGMSPISSRKSVPLSAATNRPLWSAIAPVNDPFMCPKSSLSSSVSGIAPQLIATKGWLARTLARWIARASSSLPVPLSPWISTLASPAATRCAFARRSSITDERVMMSSRHTWPEAAVFDAPPCSERARSICASNSSASYGFVR
jgi:hypothetical protein